MLTAQNESRVIAGKPIQLQKNNDFVDRLERQNLLMNANRSPENCIISQKSNAGPIFYCPTESILEFLSSVYLFPSELC